MSVLNGWIQFPAANRISYASTQRSSHQWLLLLSLLFFYQPVSVFPNNQENLKLLRERIHGLQKDLIIKQEFKQDTSSALRKTQETINTITHRLLNLKEEDRKAVAEYRHLQTQYQHIKHQTNSERDQLGELLYQQYLQGNQNYLRLAINQQNPNQIARAAYYYRQLSTSRMNSLRNLQLNQEKLEALILSSRQKKDEIAAIQAKYFEQHKKLEREKTTQQNLLAQISGQIVRQQQEIEKLTKDERQLNKLINEINKINIHHTTTNNQSLINNKLPDTSLAATPFTIQKGKLNLPVRGKLVNTFGGQRTGKQLTWKGLFIQSNEGSEVKAISSGKIVFADWLRGFGYLIIVDHGNSYMSLYGNNATLRKQTGETIHGGDTIATVGNSSGNLETGLYFELRHQGKPFDPMTWIKIE
ncbi:MAG: peptidoglycan DD-metalloendopeptidase family protein [Nitrosomonas sp.]|nr:MAG: peptidoglycan DD-metalloendopeptidase family protein [Nitrosomonas sp.]